MINMRWFATNIRTFLLALVLGFAVWVSAVTAQTQMKRGLSRSRLKSSGRILPW